MPIVGYGLQGISSIGLCLCQLGTPLSDLPVLSAVKAGCVPSTITAEQNKIPTPARRSKSVLHTASQISFVRSRMLYARAAFNAKGEVRFGLRHIREHWLRFFKHVLIQCRCSE